MTGFDSMVARAEGRGYGHQDAIDLAYDILAWLEGWDDVDGWPDKPEWDGRCVVCGHDFRECQGECTCLSCAAERQAMETIMRNHYSTLDYTGGKATISATYPETTTCICSGLRGPGKIRSGKLLSSDGTR